MKGKKGKDEPNQTSRNPQKQHHQTDQPPKPDPKAPKGGPNTRKIGDGLAASKITKVVPGRCPLPFASTRLSGTRS